MTYENAVVTPGLVVAETANALKVVLPTALPCPTEDIFSIPSVEDLLKPLLEIRWGPTAGAPKGTKRRYFQFGSLFFAPFAIQLKRGLPKIPST